MHLITNIRFLVAAALMCILSGCTISPAVDAVSWTVDGVSYFITGKSMVDHTMSAASGQDCAWLRVVKGETACLPHDEDVAGDRMVFQVATSDWVDSDDGLADHGDPLSVDPSLHTLVAPLGQVVRVTVRPTAVAAIAGDAPLIDAGFVVRRGETVEAAPVVLVKNKSAVQAQQSSRATVLWLPVEGDEGSF